MLKPAAMLTLLACGGGSGLGLAHLLGMFGSLGTALVIFGTLLYAVVRGVAALFAGLFGEEPEASNRRR
ncbi:MAG: hypothetical protein JNK82_09625 [Myxococcaceae bacterium]|nr:hypothetical protein [Myxococcaceae bacterium]